MEQERLDREDSLTPAPESQPSEIALDLTEAILGRWH